jgi:diadenosine tetraphosphate (Ap4A) HIT family hydrolase
VSSAPRWCAFCRRIERRQGLIAVRDRAVAFDDLHPLTEGHCLVAPIRHESNFFELTSDEQDDVWELVWELRELLMVERKARAFNIGVNAGRAAGQTIWHAHVHLIPRYRGDVKDPRGGVRWVIPERARYWKK